MPTITTPTVNWASYAASISTNLFVSNIFTNYNYGQSTTQPLNGKINRNNDIFYYKDNQLHREDGPAVEYSTGEKEWWINGLQHRIGGPAKEMLNHQEWYMDGLLYREDGPALIGPGFEEWYFKGKCHRENNLPAKIHLTLKQWYVHGKLHRTDGPARENSEQREWWINGKRHREDGPAIEYININVKEWWYNNRQRHVKSQQEFERWIFADKLL